jgi:RNA polymerase sigma-70 factor (ECF subfamily)
MPATLNLLDPRAVLSSADTMAAEIGRGRRAGYVVPPGPKTVARGSGEKKMAECRRNKPSERLKEFEALALEHREVVYRAALRLTRNATDAQDLVQETYLKAFRSFGHFQMGTNVRAWLFKIQTNTFITRYRRKVKERVVVEGLTEDAAIGPFVSAEQVRALQDPEGDFFRRLLSDEVALALGALPVDFRTVLILSYVEGLSHEEIATVVGCNIRTVATRLFRARKLLASKLRAYAVREGIISPEIRGAKGALVDLEAFRSRKKDAARPLSSAVGDAARPAAFPAGSEERTSARGASSTDISPSTRARAKR